VLREPQPRGDVANIYIYCEFWDELPLHMSALGFRLPRRNYDGEVLTFKPMMDSFHDELAGELNEYLHCRLNQFGRVLRSVLRSDMPTLGLLSTALLVSWAKSARVRPTSTTRRPPRRTRTIFSDVAALGGPAPTGPAVEGRIYIYFLFFSIIWGRAARPRPARPPRTAVPMAATAQAATTTLPAATRAPTTRAPTRAGLAAVRTMRGLPAETLAPEPSPVVVL